MYGLFELGFCIFVFSLAQDFIGTYCVRISAQGREYQAAISTFLLYELGTYITRQYVQHEYLSHVFSVGAALGAFLVIILHKKYMKKYARKFSCPLCEEDFTPLRSDQGALTMCPSCNTPFQICGDDLMDISQILPGIIMVYEDEPKTEGVTFQ